MWQKGIPKEILDAMWKGDTVYLWEVAPCNCCCVEHFFINCKARVWHGCIAQYEDYRWW